MRPWERRGDVVSQKCLQAAAAAAAGIHHPVKRLLRPPPVDGGDQSEFDADSVVGC